MIDITFIEKFIKTKKKFTFINNENFLLKKITSVFIKKIFLVQFFFFIMLPL